MKAGILIGHKLYEVILCYCKVFAVRSGIDCSDWRNKARFPSADALLLAHICASGSVCLKINQSGISAGDSFSPQIVRFCPVQPVSGSVQEHLLI